MLDSNLSQRQSTKHQVQRPKDLTGLSQPHRFLNKVITTRAAHFHDVARFDRKEAAGVWPVLINTASGRAISILLQERALENKFAAGAATIAFTTTERESSYCFGLAKVCVYKPANLSLRLPSAKFCLRKFSRAKALLQSLFERSLFRRSRTTIIFHLEFQR